MLGAAENDKVIGATRLAIAHLLFQSYRDEYDAIFPVALDPALADAARFPAIGKPGESNWDLMAAADQQIVNRIFVDYGKAIAAYMRRLVAKNAAFDRWVAGDAQALSDSAVHGLKLFIAKGCVSCHEGPRFTDDDFHWDATVQIGAHVPTTDNGRVDDFRALQASAFTATSEWSDAPTAFATPASIPRSVFRTKSLRDVGTTAPYMHCGQLATLEAVLDHYTGDDGAPSVPPPSGGDSGGYGGSSSGTTPPPAPAPDPPPAHFVALTPAEKAQLVSFLKTLDGEPLDPRLLRAEGP